MKHLLRTALLVAAAAAVPAFAQDAPTAVDPGLTASTGASADLETVMEAIRAGKTNIGAIASLSAVGEVEVVRLGDLPGGTDGGALEAAISESQADISALQKVMADNQALEAELDANAVAVSDVVAANVEADGSLTIFAR